MFNYSNINDTTVHSQSTIIHDTSNSTVDSRNYNYESRHTKSKKDLCQKSIIQLTFMPKHHLKELSEFFSTKT